MRTACLAIALALAATTAGCLAADSAFVCNGDSSCGSGHCVARFCASIDATCAMGFRWDPSAGPRAGSCAEIPDLAMSDDLAIDPKCGNGMLDPGETCDPGPGSPMLCPTSVAQCDDGEPCTNDILDGVNCKARCLHSYDNLGDGVKCPVPDGGSAGTCYKHTCCTGCWDGRLCSSGLAATVCGNAGATCADCLGNPDAGVECVASSCAMSGNCLHDPVPDNTACAAARGACHGGGCCTGCFQTVSDGGVCQAGSDDKLCGSGGGGCVACPLNNPCGATDGGYRCTGCVPQCNGKLCGDDGCGGSCGACAPNQLCKVGQCACAGAAENTDPLCSDGIDNDCNMLIDCQDPGCASKQCSIAGGKYCIAKLCAPACRIGGVVYPSGAANPNNVCQVCDPKVNDSLWTAADGATCMGGKGICHSGTCCAGCWDGAACHTASSSFCGMGGGACVDCGIANNPCVLDGCDSNGACTHTDQPDGTVCGGPPTGCGGARDECQFRCSNCTVGPACLRGQCDLGANLWRACCTPLVTNCATSMGVATCKIL